MGTFVLSARLGYSFDDERLAELALTHRSWCAENDDPASNERLEFLGDAIVGLAVAAYLYERYPELPEGELAKVRASVVSAASLAELGRRLELGSGLRLGKGESASGGSDKTSILADAVEAVIGAAFIDQGWEASRQLVEELLAEQIDRTARDPGVHDYKTRLQELIARRNGAPPRYLVSESGPDHEKRFAAQVLVDDVVHGTGEGTSKKQAEQEAARRAWSSLADE